MGAAAMGLAAMGVWLAHFSLIYGIVSVADVASGDAGAAWARIAVLAATAACLAVNALLLWRLRRTKAGPSGFRQVGQGGVLISSLAILYQGLPAVLA